MDVRNRDRNLPLRDDKLTLFQSVSLSLGRINRVGRVSPPAEARLLSDRLLNTDGVTMRYPPHNYQERNDHEQPNEETRSRNREQQTQPAMAKIKCSPSECP